VSPIPNPHTPLTLLVLTLNRLIDGGRYDDIRPAEVVEAIDGGRVLKFLQRRCSPDARLGDFLGGPNGEAVYAGFVRFYNGALQALLDTHGGGREWGVENRGLCLLLAWTNELLQMGTGWMPPRDLASRRGGAVDASYAGAPGSAHLTADRGKARVFLHTRPKGKRTWTNEVRDFGLVPAVGECVVLDPASEWYQVRLVVHSPPGCSFDADVYALEVDRSALRAGAFGDRPAAVPVTSHPGASSTAPTPAPPGPGSQ
jgi:hypothetical protein